MLDDIAAAIMKTFYRANAEIFIFIALIVQLNHVFGMSLGKFRRRQCFTMFYVRIVSQRKLRVKPELLSSIFSHEAR